MKNILSIDSLNLNSAVKETIKDIASNCKYKYSKSFKVIDQNKNTLDDIEHIEGMEPVKMDIKEPKFGINTPPHIVKLVTAAYKYMKETGFPYPTTVNVSKDIKSPIFQRDIDITRCTKIAKEFNPHIFNALKLVYFDGDDKLSNGEGDHTCAATIMRGYIQCPALISCGISMEESARYFRLQDDNKRKLSYLAKMDAADCEGEPAYMGVEYACNKYRIKVKSEDAYPKKINSIRKCKQIVDKYGYEGLIATFHILEAAGWGNQAKAYGEAALNIGYGMLNTIKDNDGVFDYESFLYELKAYPLVTDFLEYMDSEIDKKIDDRHPEATPTMYISRHYGV